VIFNHKEAKNRILPSQSKINHDFPPSTLCAFPPERFSKRGFANANAPLRDPEIISYKLITQRYVMFPVTSRYYSIEIAKFVAQDGQEVAYLRRRFLPNTPVITQAEYSVTEGDRLDNITARYLGDPEQFWRLCDANNAMQPDELTDEIGRRLVIPLIQGG
jgi:hypothetical protein